MTQTLVTLRQGNKLAWWQYGKIIGAMALVGLLVALALGIEVPGLAVTLHIALDFSLQSNEIAMHKGERKVHLLIHAVIVGGLPGIVTGSLVGMAVGIATHYLVDYTRKFGLDEMPGAIADQTAHLLVLMALAI